MFLLILIGAGIFIVGTNNNEYKSQFPKQQEQINDLSSELKQKQSEYEILRAENKSLIENISKDQEFVGTIKAFLEDFE